MFLEKILTVSEVEFSAKSGKNGEKFLWPSEGIERGSLKSDEKIFEFLLSSLTNSYAEFTVQFGKNCKKILGGL